MFTKKEIDAEHRIWVKSLEDEILSLKKLLKEKDHEITLLEDNGKE